MLIEVFYDTKRKCKELLGSKDMEEEYYDINTVNQLAEAHHANYAKEIYQNRSSHTNTWVSTDDSYTAALKMKQEQEISEVLVLNMANSISRGGGVLVGAPCQEEDLCRVSSLYQSLGSEEGKKFYEFNRQYDLDKYGSDTAIYSPHVYVIKDYDYNELEPMQEVSVITMAAPKYQGEKSQKKSDTTDIMDTTGVMDQRIYKLLCIAKDTGHKNLVLGAWGCGDFDNDPDMVAELFKKNLEKFSSFENVVFAIKAKEKEDKNYSCFSKVFGNHINI